MKWLRSILGVTLGTWLLVGLGYPLVMTGISQVLFPYQANGSPVKLGNRIVASLHVGQYYHQPQYFWGRPSATTPPYNPYASTPSNLGPTNKLLLEHVKSRIKTLQRSIPGLRVSQIPISLVESSGSGLDPDISVQSALIQIPRVSRATGLSRGFLTRLIDQHVSGPQFGVIGRSRINVMELNLAVYKALHPHA
ncbi:MAG: potassium-transporting ATPase subunit KdpC [Firmicutes bacterium]|jgi:K+-transporting ATPase ATPase C chain|uniref:Potassium-transporting ATPase KdpC subunit n=1 Tax=Sulfobacillus benefaciens TaxID=453960 RepID=A0A2T2WQ62_9FIRM|nr:potassium-transporting ATPase subunit KdpC [Bacillota bacterium]MCL5015215.1 potassium-transporting ATPase subunit KdpC [Bacillota bacterium]PSR24378.1 MAG: potassium-transporting ATPase subunit C [Sulfobacillus benefaciens]HBQ94794.1 potassium-transporting ATPase subunit C [Sulfobacillus sp.]